MNRAPAYGVRIDYIAETLIAIFLITVLFAGLGGLIGTDQASFNLAIFMVLMEVTAISLWVVSKTYQVAPNLGRGVFANNAKYLVVGLAAFFVLNFAVPLVVPLAAQLSFSQLSISTGPKFVTVMMAVPEESLFRGWAAPFFARRTGVIGGAVLSGGMFAIYHVFVYGDSLPQMVIVFGAGIVFGLIVLKTRELYSTMAVHFIANAISVGIL